MPSSRRKRSGRGVDAKGRSIAPERYLRLPHYLLKSRAWKSLRPLERSLFVEVAQRYDGHNNGEIALGVREAGAALHVRPHTAGKAFDVLVATGFLVVARDSAFNVKARLAREWTVTLFPRGTQPASHDFMRWTPNSATQCRSEPRPVTPQATPRNERTCDGDASGHRDREFPPSDGGLDRHTSIGHAERPRTPPDR